MRSSRGKRAIVLGRLAGHVLVAALCLETAARLDDKFSYGAPFWRYYDPDGLRAPDAEGVVRNVPGASFEKWRINALGFRGETIALERVPGRRRIGCLGTSETFGLYERESGEWPARLGRLLKEKSHPDVDVFNASVVGLNRGTRQRYVDKYVLPLRPDVLVLYLNVLSEASYRPPLPGTSAPPAGASLWARLPASRVLPKLRRAVRKLVPDSIWRRYRVWSLSRAVRRGEAAVLGTRPSADVLPAEAASRFEAYLRDLIGAERERGIAPVLATYPTLGAVTNRERYRAEFLDERIWHLELSELGMIDAATRLNDVIRRVGGELAVPVADADAALPKTSDYFSDYVHYTDAGAELVAGTVFAALERAGLLESGVTPVKRVETVERPR